VVAKFKMATRTKFAYVAKKTLVRIRTFGLFDFYRFWAEKNKKKNIRKLQNQIWPLNSRWPPTFDLLLKPTNRLFDQKKCLLYRLSKS
jgi:hypothetical protein